MPSWAGRMAATRKAVDNHSEGHAAKVELRRLVLDQLGAERCHVLDLFAGQGTMYRAVWREAGSYTGCDERWFSDERLAFVADNRRLLRCLDLAPFTVFDLDAYGSPWEQATIIAARRRMAPSEQLGIVWTDGASTRAKLGRIEGAMAQLAGVASDIQGGYHHWGQATRRAVEELAGRMGGTVTDMWASQRKSVWYGAAVLRG